MLAVLLLTPPLCLLAAGLWLLLLPTAWDASRGALPKLSTLPYWVDGRRARLQTAGSLGGVTILAALGCVAAVAALWLASTTSVREVRLYPWSPLGLYGVTLSLHVDPVSLTIALLPPVAAAAALLSAARGERDPGGTGRNGRPLGAALLAASAAGFMSAAGDLIALGLGFMTLSLAVCASAWLTAGAPHGRRSLACGYGAGICLLLASVSLARFNGSVAYTQLSPSTFGVASLGLWLVAVLYAAGAVPGCRWVGWVSQRGSPPALVSLGAAAGAALTLALRTHYLSGGGAGLASTQLLQAAGAALLVGGVAWALIAPSNQIPALLLISWVGQLLIALSAGTAEVVAAALLYVVAQTVAVAGLLLTSQSRPRAASAARGAGAAASGDPRPLLARLPPLALLASACALPGTLGGFAWSWLSGAAALAPGWASWAFALLVASQLTLVVPLARLARPSLESAARSSATRRWLRRVPLALPFDRARDGPPPRRYGRPSLQEGWILLVSAALVALLIVPAVAPAPILGWWSAAVLTSLQGRPPITPAFHVAQPNYWWGLASVCVLLAVLRPPVLFLGWRPKALAREKWRRLSVVARRGMRRLAATCAPLRVVQKIAEYGTRLVDGAIAVAAPLEERYYAAAVLLLAVLLMYVVGR